MVDYGWKTGRIYVELKPFLDNIVETVKCKGERERERERRGGGGREGGVNR